MMKSRKSYMPFKLGAEEVEVKDYNAAIMKRPEKMEGHIIITNKRAILYAFTIGFLGTSKEYMLNDVHLDEVKGVTSYIGTKRSLSSIIAGIFILLFGLMMMVIGFQNAQSYYNSNSAEVPVIFGLILIIIGIVLILWKTKSIYIHIKAARVPGIEIGVIKKGPIQITGTKPGPDAERMVYEISAVIADLQKQQGVKDIDEL